MPLRKGSVLKGREKGWWRPLGPDALKILDAFRRYQLAARKKGERFGPGGPLAERILRYLINLAKLKKDGQCDPTLETIATKCNCCISAVVNALKALRKHGFVDWLRRYDEAKEPTSWGPQIQQTSNAYRISMPPAAAALLEAETAPTPADFEEAKKALADKLRAMENHDLNVIFDRWQPKLI